jgi:hypothetical protein
LAGLDRDGDSNPMEARNQTPPPLFRSDTLRGRQTKCWPSCWPFKKCKDKYDVFSVAYGLVRNPARGAKTFKFKTFKYRKRPSPYSGEQRTDARHRRLYRPDGVLAQLASAAVMANVARMVGQM